MLTLMGSRLLKSSMVPSGDFVADCAGMVLTSRLTYAGMISRGAKSGSRLAPPAYYTETTWSVTLMEVWECDGHTPTRPLLAGMGIGAAATWPTKTTASAEKRERREKNMVLSMQRVSGRESECYVCAEGKEVPRSSCGLCKMNVERSCGEQNI